jgi:PDZ domain-containing protein
MKLLIAIKKILKENYRVIIFFIALIMILNYPMPYYISTGGGISNLGKKVIVENGYKQKGSYNLSYVSQINANFLSYSLSYILPDWEREKVNDYKISDIETKEDVEERAKLSLNTANDVATIVAYKSAGKDVNIKEINYYIANISNPNIKILKTGDKLLKVNDVSIGDFSEIKDEIKNNESVVVTVLRNKEEISETINVNENGGVKEVGLSFMEAFDYEVSPKVTFKFNKDESGGSAGLMTTLAIYDSLVEEDLTHGYTIAGTGTISMDGSVGEIGGINYKLKGAVSGKADIFFAPAGDNYKDAMKIKKEKKYKIDIVEVNEFDDAVNYLKKLK